MTPPTGARQGRLEHERIPHARLLRQQVPAKLVAHQTVIAEACKQIDEQRERIESIAEPASLSPALLCETNGQDVGQLLASRIVAQDHLIQYQQALAVFVRRADGPA